MNLIFDTIDRQQYKFPSTSSTIDVIVGLTKPTDINLTVTTTNENFFKNFIQQINCWYNWFDRFIDIFQYLIEWLKNHNVIRSSQLYNDLINIRNDPKTTLIDMKDIVNRTLKILSPFKDLRRLCHLFNCLTDFQIIDPGTLNSQDNTSKYLAELKRFPNSTFTVERTHDKILSIVDHQQVQWSLASEDQSCHITIEYRTHGFNSFYKVLYRKDNIPIHKHVLNGQFEIQRSGQLILTIVNPQNFGRRKIWFRIKSNDLSTCHLFHGIFKIHYDKYYKNRVEPIQEKEFNGLLDKVLGFIDKLLNGSLSLRDMTELISVFCDKNINIREEVKKLYATRSTEQTNDHVPMNQAGENEIAQVCEWLQIYQYYSHVNIIMKCIEKFDIIPSNTQDETIVRLKLLGGNEDCQLRDIVQAYKILQQRFQKLTHQHLQLIKMVVECFLVVNMMKKADLYSQNGRRRFQELRDNLTTQFQLQERNNMILNSWIITCTLVEPFTNKVTNFDEFVKSLAQLTNLEETSLNHIQGKIIRRIFLSIKLKFLKKNSYQ